MEIAFGFASPPQAFLAGVGNTKRIVLTEWCKGENIPGM